MKVLVVPPDRPATEADISKDDAKFLHDSVSGYFETALIEDGTYDRVVEERYAGWQTTEAKAMLSGKRSLEQIAARVEKQKINPQPRSGQQEYLENLINRFV